MKKTSLKTFLAHFDTKIKDYRKFCFVLGAGASKTSGILTGAELAKLWMEQLNKIYSENELKDWKKEAGVSRSNLSSCYTQIYDKRFALDKEEGFIFLEELMEGKDPSCGYSMLAQILDKTHHKIVITTNFDNLTEDALFIYTQRKPLVIVHESLADYITLDPKRPIIVKIHRDLFFAPKNTTEQTSDLSTSYNNSLAAIFKHYTPLVIGYGGNDGSLMEFLEKLQEVKGGMFWFYRQEDGEPNIKIQKLVEKFDGFGVPIAGFDELMIQLGNKLKINLLDRKTIIDIAKKRADVYGQQIEIINMSTELDPATKEALSALISRGEKSWWHYQLLASNEKTPDKQENIYRDGLIQLPQSAELHQSYAHFLHTIRKDYDRAEKLYQEAITLDPKDAHPLLGYALLLYIIRKDYDRAEKLYQEAIALDPENCIYLDSYATFLHTIRKDYDRAEKLYKKAVTLDKNNISWCNYTGFLLSRGKFTMGLLMLDKILPLMNNSELPDDLVTECWFYAFAHSPSHLQRKEALKNLKRVLQLGKRSPNWDLTANISQARENGHPDVIWLDKLSDVINDKADISSLNAWPKWKNI